MTNNLGQHYGNHNDLLSNNNLGQLVTTKKL